MGHVLQTDQRFVSCGGVGIVAGTAAVATLADIAAVTASSSRHSLCLANVNQVVKIADVTTTFHGQRRWVLPAAATSLEGIRMFVLVLELSLLLLLQR